MFKPILSRMSKMQELLEQLYDDITEAAHSSNRIYKTAKEPHDYFTHSWKLRHSLREPLGTKRISLEELLKLWIPKWKSERRIHFAPRITISLTKEEAKLLDLAEPKEVDIYELFCLMMGMFKR